MEIKEPEVPKGMAQIQYYAWKIVWKQHPQYPGAKIADHIEVITGQKVKVIRVREGGMSWGEWEARTTILETDEQGFAFINVQPCNDNEYYIVRVNRHDYYAGKLRAGDVVRVGGYWNDYRVRENLPIVLKD